MRQEELEKILEQHQLWLDSDGEEGKQAVIDGEELGDLYFGHLLFSGWENAYKCIKKTANIFGDIEVTLESIKDGDITYKAELKGGVILEAVEHECEYDCIIWNLDIVCGEEIKIKDLKPYLISISKPDLHRNKIKTDLAKVLKA